MELGLIDEIYELLDKEIQESIVRKKKWSIELKSKEKTIEDIAGTIRFKRTGYVDKRTGKYVYLLDKILGIDPHQKLTLAAAAKVLEEAIDSSYRKGGEAVNDYNAVDKMTVLRLVHDIEIETPIKEPGKKKKLKQLHIVADEDHVSLQFNQTKGDLKHDANGNKINTVMPRLICLFEDVVDDAPEKSQKHRYRLVGKHYFSNTQTGPTANYNFWKEVDEYIFANYDTEYLERIYIAGDGAPWIKSGVEILGAKSRFYLDKFHMMKYVNKSTTHLLDSTEDVKSEIWRCLNGGYKEELKEIYKQILAVTEKESKYKDVEDALTYFLNQWDGIMCRVQEAAGCWKCCAEGQISHVYSKRLSRNPMGWSEHGCEQMAKLRVFKQNGGKVIDLLKYQKKIKRQQNREEHEALIRDVRRSHTAAVYEERIHGTIPGMEMHSMKWLKDIINGVITA
ncbi:MAG: ISLre2 family transposase [Lachnospiraceae bacterium]|nr:ISLre2 family transposase [Lachnospiraceae bacterium]